MADNFIQNAVATAATQMTQSNAASQAVSTEQPADVQQVAETPSFAVRVPRKNSKAPTLESTIRNAIAGGGSLTSPTMHIGAVRSDVRRALKFDPTNANLQAAQTSLSTEPADTASGLSFLQAAYTSIGGKPTKSMSSMIMPQPTTLPVNETPEQASIAPQRNSNNSILSRNVATVQGLSRQKSSSGLTSSGKRISL